MTRYILILALAASSLTACGKKQVVDVGPEFTPYVGRFEERSATEGTPVKVSNLIVKFGPMEKSSERGICDVPGDGSTPTITVNQDTWNNLGDDERELLIFHEMGHCVLSRKHSSQVTSEGIPASLMNPYALDSDTYDENHDYYMNELFHPQAGT